jgi:hypothetical protein
MEARVEGDRQTPRPWHSLAWALRLGVACITLVVRVQNIWVCQQQFVYLRWNQRSVQLVAMATIHGKHRSESAQDDFANCSNKDLDWLFALGTLFL